MDLGGHTLSTLLGKLVDLIQDVKQFETCVLSIRHKGHKYIGVVPRLDCYSNMLEAWNMVYSTPAHKSILLRDE